ncbi:unnamed protein product [Caenorhabditis auriculariae]|uniref:Uncharacterized protein n=1 Tax=Caenorhabditis auriculariae TaxID=2777116 RepID=A0A8S1HEM8_9PELO|nr:unnamed protein product [Caenorhabditis auriculariae]
MSRDVSLSPKSETTRLLEDPLPSLSVVDEEHPMSLLSFSTPLTSSEEMLKEKKDEEQKDRKKRHKSFDEPRKRKDTATSITNFFHRFTRSDKEDKDKDKKKDGIEEETEEEIGRPDKLASPDSSEEMWFGAAGDGSMLGYEGEEELYEWEPDTMTEKLVVEPVPQQEAASGSSQFEEQTLLQLLEDFRNGEMHFLTEPQLEAMRTVKRQHEDVTNTHLKIAQLQGDDSEEKEENLERMFDELSEKITNMHAVFDNGLALKLLTNFFLNRMAANEPPATEFGDLESLCKAINGLSSGDSNALSTGKKAADITRKNREVFEKKSCDIEAFLLNCNHVVGSTAMIAAIKSLFDTSVAKNYEAGADRAVELLKYYLDGGQLVAEHLRLVPDIFLPLVRSVGFYCLEKKKKVRFKEFI